MKSRILFVLFAVLGNNIYAQNWLWAQNFTGDPSCTGNYVTTRNQNIYCFGGYEPGGSIVAGNTTISSIGHTNSFVAQFDQSGNLANIIGALSTTIDNMYNGGITVGSPVTTDDSNNMYITLAITDNGLVDTIPVTGTPTINKQTLSKWTSDSRCLWVKSYPGNKLSPKSSGNNIYVICNYQQSVAQIGNFHLSDSSGKQQSYLAQLNGQGNCNWVKQSTGGNTNFNFIDADNNHIYVSATTDSCFAYDTINVCGMPGKGLGVLMQLDTLGSIKWLKKISAADQYSSPGKISIIKGGGFYTQGFFDTTFYIGNDTLHKTGNEIFDDYIARFDDLGNLMWVRQFPFTGIPGGIGAIVADSMSYIYFSGYFNGTQKFGNYTLTAQSANELFITRYTPSGNCMGVITVPNAVPLDLTEDNAGNAIVTGYIKGTAVFGGTTLNGTATGNFFVAKLSAITDSTNGEQTLLPNDSTLRIYANPSRGLFTIDVPEGIIQATNGTLTVYNNAGNLIKTQPVDISGSNAQVNLGEVMRGVYTVLLTANGKEFKGRVVIQ